MTQTFDAPQATSELKSPLDIVILTGFLGAGKTTLLAHWLKDPAFSDTAVIVNEFGAVGIDHHLLESASHDVLLLENGCLCCSLQEDFLGQVRGLLDQRAGGIIPPFSRLVIETTGLADPIPILVAFLSDPVLSSCFAVPEVVTVVDGVHHHAHLSQMTIAAKQLACADLLIVSKTDQLDVLELKSIIQNIGQRATAQILISSDQMPVEITEVIEGLAAVQASNGKVRDLHRHDHFHDGPQSFTFETDKPQKSQAINAWIAGILRDHGHRLLRMKGIFEVADEQRSIVLQAVGQIVDPPREIEFSKKGTRVVLILENDPASPGCANVFAQLSP